MSYRNQSRAAECRCGRHAQTAAVCVCGALVRGRVAVGVVVVRAELGPVRDVILEHDLLWVGRARQELLARTDLLEHLLGLSHTSVRHQ